MITKEIDPHQFQKSTHISISRSDGGKVSPNAHITTHHNTTGKATGKGPTENLKEGRAGPDTRTDTMARLYGGSGAMTGGGGSSGGSGGDVPKIILRRDRTSDNDDPSSQAGARARPGGDVLGNGVAGSARNNPFATAGGGS